VQAQHADLPIAEDLDVLDLVGDVAPTPDLAERLEEAGQDAKLSFEVQPNGQLKLNVDRLGALGKSESLKWLRKTTPKIDLPDQLFEVDSWPPSCSSATSMHCTAQACSPPRSSLLEGVLRGFEALIPVFR
jgi:hypothetical protein